MNKQAFEQGVVDRCKQLGIDPIKLVKVAQEDYFTAGLKEKARQEALQQEQDRIAQEQLDRIKSWPPFAKLPEDYYKRQAAIELDERYKRRNKKLQTVYDKAAPPDNTLRNLGIGARVGALGGGVLGSLLSKKKNRARNALLAALAGSAVGAGLVYGYNKLNPVQKVNTSVNSSPASIDVSAPQMSPK